MHDMRAALPGEGHRPREHHVRHAREVTKHDILMVGVGGQGIVLASDIVAEAALAAGYDVKKSDTLGMAQRGGSVVSHVRMAEHVYAPLIRAGEADVLLALEKLEAARWVRFLRPEGVAIVNNHSRPPLSVNLGVNEYPSDEEVAGLLGDRTDRFRLVNGSDMAERLGEIRAVNILMLGYLSALLPITVETWRECLSRRIPAKILELNVAAFEQGRREALNADIRQRF